MRGNPLLWIGSAGLAAGAAISGYYTGHANDGYFRFLLFGLMLFLPLFDRKWRPPKIPAHPRNLAAWGTILLLTVVLIALKHQYFEASVSSLVTAAIPEEWYFRAYIMPSLGCGLPANLIASILFSAMHGLSRGWRIAVSVFAPSVFYGWLYQRTRDLPLLILTHALSNIVFMMFIAPQIPRWVGLG